MRNRIVLFFAIASACAFVAAQASPCPEGHPVTGDLGIEYLLCVGGSCSVNLRTDRGYVHDFSTEPRIRGLEEGGPSSGKLHNGDVLIAVDGALITTREGGRRLANLTPGKPVNLRVRRGGQEIDVTVVPRSGCNMPRLMVLGGSGVTPVLQKTPATPKTPQTSRTPETPRTPMPPSPAVDFGMEIDCGNCGWRRDADDETYFYTSRAPLVLSVVAGGPAERAGLRPGDVLLKVADRPFPSRMAGELLGKLRPDQPVTLEVGRGGSLRTVQIVPRSAEPRRQRF